METYFKKILSKSKQQNQVEVYFILFKLMDLYRLYVFLKIIYLNQIRVKYKFFYYSLIQ
jgi:hypothetical protein